VRIIDVDAGPDVSTDARVGLQPYLTGHIGAQRLNKTTPRIATTEISQLGRRNCNVTVLFALEMYGIAAVSITIRFAGQSGDGHRQKRC
jgi:hypothetical protein